MNSVEAVKSILPGRYTCIFSVNFNCVGPYIPFFSGDNYSFKVPINFFSTQFSSLMGSFDPVPSDLRLSNRCS